jgi:hypothetical protein
MVASLIRAGLSEVNSLSSKKGWWANAGTSKTRSAITNIVGIGPCFMSGILLMLQDLLDLNDSFKTQTVGRAEIWPLGMK